MISLIISKISQNTTQIRHHFTNLSPLILWNKIKIGYFPQTSNISTSYHSGISIQNRVYSKNNNNMIKQTPFGLLAKNHFLEKKSNQSNNFLKPQLFHSSKKSLMNSPPQGENLSKEQEERIFRLKPNPGGQIPLGSDWYYRHIRARKILTIARLLFVGGFLAAVYRSWGVKHEDWIWKIPRELDDDEEEEDDEQNQEKEEKK